MQMRNWVCVCYGGTLFSLLLSSLSANVVLIVRLSYITMETPTISRYTVASWFCYMLKSAVITCCNLLLQIFAVRWWGYGRHQQCWKPWRLPCTPRPTHCAHTRPKLVIYKQCIKEYNWRSAHVHKTRYVPPNLLSTTVCRIVLA